MYLTLHSSLASVVTGFWPSEVSGQPAKKHESRDEAEGNGGTDETRTRDLWRDRKAVLSDFSRPLQSRVDTVWTKPLKMAQSR